MHVEKRTGQVPGTIYATIRHGTTHRTFGVEVERTSSGRFVARMPDQRWSPECATLDNAILLHAAIAFPVEVETAPWLSNLRPADRFAFLTPSPLDGEAPDDRAKACVSFESA